MRFLYDEKQDESRKYEDIDEEEEIRSNKMKDVCSICSIVLHNKRKASKKKKIEGRNGNIKESVERKKILELATG